MAMRIEGHEKDRHIGCPMSWLRRVRPVVKSKSQLIVAIWLWRRKVICGNRVTFDVPNGELKSLGVSPRTKYRALALLEAAGEIVLGRNGKRALTVTIRPSRKR